MRDIRRVFAIGVSIYDAALLKVTTRDLGEMVEVRVRDNGTGIAPKIRDRLFQPFVTTKPTGEGTGLGLSKPGISSPNSIAARSRWTAPLANSRIHDHTAAQRSGRREGA